MRHLAIARYRLLTTIRGANWVFAISLGVALLFLAGSPAVHDAASEVRIDPWGAAHLAATIAIACYLLHTAIVFGGCLAFGSSRMSRANAGEVADLMDTAPLTSGIRFWGDALGTFAAAMIVHLCTLPLLALAVALSPLTTGAFVKIELAIVALLILGGTASSWKLHAPASKWSQTRAPRSAATFLILLIVVLVTNTRWEAFREAAANVVSEPAPRHWAELVAAIDSPPLLLLQLFLLLAGFIAFYYFHAVRSLEPR
jgi:hypothetical protein